MVRLHRSWTLRLGFISQNVSCLKNSDGHLGLLSAHNTDTQKKKGSSHPFHTYFGLEQSIPGRCLFVSIGSKDWCGLDAELSDGWGWVRGIETILNNYVYLGLLPVCAFVSRLSQCCYFQGIQRAVRWCLQWPHVSVAFWLFLFSGSYFPSTRNMILEVQRWWATWKKKRRGYISPAFNGVWKMPKSCP